MLIIATRNLAKGRMRAGQSYEVDDDEGQRLIDANLARSGETLAERDPELAEALIAIPPTEVLLERGNEVNFEEVVGERDVAL